MSDRVKREVRELVEGFGPPGPGLAARAVAGLPDRPRRAPALWTVAAAAALAIATVGLLIWTARGAAHRTVPATHPAASQLRQRPLVAVPLVDSSCQVDQGRASVRTNSATVTLVSPSLVPPDGLMTVDVINKPRTSTVVGVVAGYQVSGLILVRGHRLDGPGTMSFALGPSTTSPHQSELDLNIDPQTRRWDVSVQADTQGCYAIQFDNARFTEEAVLMLYSSAPVSLPLPTERPTPQTMTPAQADAAVRAAVTAAQPVLLPGALVNGWQVQVSGTSDWFSASYTDSTGTREFDVRMTQANPPPPTDKGTQSHPAFHGDRRSLYQVNDSTDPRSSRFLMWREPGTSSHQDPTYPGVDYFAFARGLTEPEFWQLANSLH